MHNWSKYEVVKFYERLLDRGVIKKGGKAYNRMLEVKDKIEVERNNKRLSYIERMRHAIKASNGKA
tara:strand:+ start:136 stop:333 length:198 start_codon:yes stop_codon:yes gene_type:complete